MTGPFIVSRTRTGLWLAMCVKCGYSGRFKTEPAAREAEMTHLCTHPEGVAA